MANSLPWPLARSAGTTTPGVAPGPATPPRVEVQQYQRYACDTSKPIVRKAHASKARGHASDGPLEETPVVDASSGVAREPRGAQDPRCRHLRGCVLCF